MAKKTAYLVKGADNVVTLNVTEAGNPTTLNWTEITVYIGPILEITRTSASAGVTFSSGVLGITPSDLTEDLSTLTNDEHRVMVRVKSSTTPTGSLFGADDSTDEMFFSVSDPV